MRHLSLAAFLACLAAPLWAEGIAVFPVKLLDTSHEARDQRADHDRRLMLFGQVLADHLPDARLIDLQALDACQPQRTECLLALARDQGADQAVFVVIQKTSTLILQVFANRVDLASVDRADSRNLNFRGDNDAAWERAARFLAGQLTTPR